MMHRKLTDHDEKLIRRLVRWRRSLTNAALAKRFGVSEHLISYIGSGEDFRLKWKLRRVGIEVDGNGEPLRDDRVMGPGAGW